MIGVNTYIGIGVMILFGLALPIIPAVWWIRRHRERVSTLWIGAATWFIFAVLLEAVPKYVFLTSLLPVGRAVLSHTALAIVLAALMAGLFEETGRLVAFKTLLKKRRNRETGITHGLGHGGFEAFYIMVVSGAQYLVYAVMIQMGKFQAVIDAAAAQGTDTAALEAIPLQLASMTAASGCVAALERVFAMLLHVGLSILVFHGVKRSKLGPWLLAILLHALFDVPAALYQFGIIRNVYVVEALLAVYSLVFFFTVYRIVYRKEEAGTGTEEAEEAVTETGAEGETETASEEEEEGV